MTNILIGISFILLGMTLIVVSIRSAMKQRPPRTRQGAARS